MDASFEIFDHTADAGLRVFAPTMADLIAPATAGLYALIGDLSHAGDPSDVRYDFSGDSEPYLLRDYLGEVLALFENDRRVVTAFESVEFAGDQLTIAAKSAAIDLTQTEFHREVKAITYHELDIRAIPGGYEATIIVDI